MENCLFFDIQSLYPLYDSMIFFRYIRFRHSLVNITGSVTRVSYQPTTKKSISSLHLAWSRTGYPLKYYGRRVIVKTVLENVERKGERMNRKVSLIFDIDDTLYSQMDPLLSACEASLGKKLGDPERFYRIFCRRSGEMFLFSENGQVTIEQSRIYRIMNTMKDLGIPYTEEMARDFQRRYQENQSRLSVSETLCGILDACKKEGFFLGIITNGPLNHQMSKYYNMKLERWIPQEHVLVSAGVGFAKPDERIFRLAEERMELDREHTYMIGDSYENDILGAINAGWKTIWMNHHRYPVPEGVKAPDHIAYTEEELGEILRRTIKEET